jgi:hypothetical protein
VTTQKRDRKRLVTIWGFDDRAWLDPLPAKVWRFRGFDVQIAGVT